MLPGAQPSCHVDQAKVGDNGAAVLQEDVLCLQILVNNPSVVKIAHALSYKTFVFLRINPRIKIYVNMYHN